MGSKDIDVYERRARARTNSSDTMLSESNVQLLPMDLHNKQSVVRSTETKQLKLSIYQIFLLNAVVCGVEICACAGFTYIPPMLLKSGYTEENMSIILGLGPLLGFFIVPLIGRASDRCRSSIGRRRPFIIVISIILLFSLVIVPYGDVLCDFMVGKGPLSKSLTLLLMTIGVILLDFTSQACLTPCEALLSDTSKDTDQHERVFIVYSLMISLGGFIGYLITAIDWNTMSLGSYFRTQEKTVFSILIMLFTVLLSATIMAAKEKPFIGNDQTENVNLNPNDTLLTISNGTESGYDSNSENGNGHILVEKKDDNPPVIQIASPKRTRIFNVLAVPRLLFRAFISCRLIVAFMNLFRLLLLSLVERLPEPIQNLCDIPLVLRRLALAHFCSWTAVMGFNLFFTDFVANAVYGGNPNAPEDSYLRNRFDEGVRMGSWGLLLHCITSAVYALFIERLVNHYGCKLTYILGMLSFSIAMFGMVLFRNAVFVNTMAAFTGFGYATITTVPFILVSTYHQEKEIYFYDVTPKKTSPNAAVRGIGTDMATLDSAYFLSQVVLSCIMGYIVHLTGSVLSYMLTAGVMGIISCFVIQNLISNKQDLINLRNSQAVL